jgi:3-phosphoshikimate 1-carboxyvinyltransferase
MLLHLVTTRSAALDAEVRVPGSKSVANRALVCAALAVGESRLTGVPDGDDSAALLDCLQSLGFGIDVAGGDVRVDGGLDRFVSGPITVHARLAGTTSRFVTALAALGPGRYTVDGLPPLRERPMAPLYDALRSLGVAVTPGERAGHLPVTVGGGGGAAAQASTRASTTAVSMPGDVSSQYITALMLIAPYLPGGLQIQLTTALVSRPYLRITAAVMAAFGMSDVEIGEHVIRIGPGRYAPCAYAVEPDASTAGYPLAAAAVVGGRVTVPGLTAASLQGDAAFADVLERMGCHTERNATGTTVERRGPLHGIDIDMSDLSDLVPTLAVVAPFADSSTTIRGVGFIRSKQSDRLGDLCRELRGAGVRATETDDGLVIDPSEVHGAEMGTYHDHRLAMSFALLGLRVEGIVVRDPDVVSKSWPGFWTALEALS